MSNKITAILLFLFVYHGIAVAQSDSLRTESLSLSEAISLALQENHNITVARNAARIDENNATIGNAGYLPSVFATGSYNRTNENVTQNFASDTVAQTSQQSTSKQYNAALNAEYTLFDGFGNYYRLQSLQSQEELGSVRSRLQIETILLQVVLRYLSVVAQSQLVDINQEAVEVSNERFRRAEKQYEFGGSTKVNLLNAEVALNQDSVRFVQAQSELNQAKHNLLVLLGSEPLQAISVNGDIEINKQIDLQQFLQSALNNNASLVSSELQVEQARISVKQNRAGRYPQLDAQASYSYNRLESDANFLQFQEADGLSYRLTLRFNIFNGFQRSIDIENAEIRLNNNRELREQARKELRRNVRNAYEIYSTNLFLLQKQQLNVQTAQLNFERTQQAFTLGQVSNTEFREAQLNVLRIQQELINLWVNAKLSEVELLQLAGMLVEGGL